jgi:hypothetical protein
VVYLYMESLREWLARFGRSREVDPAAVAVER